MPKIRSYNIYILELGTADTIAGHNELFGCIYLTLTTSEHERAAWNL